MWISVLESLPENDETTDKFSIDCLFTEGVQDWFCIIGKKYHSNITHWMPLPKLPGE